MSASDPTPTAPRSRFRSLVEAIPFVLVSALGLWLAWPAPIGEMPLSADHTVHLTRIWMFAEALAEGSPRGWSSIWFFGTPVGELYPVLGDLLIVALRWVTLGGLSWPAAYAIGFTIVFVSQGWVLLRVGKAMGYGPWPGLVAAALMLCDAGMYREGGWMYTVTYGVWPQALATSLVWLGLGELVRVCERTETVPIGRAVASASLAFGAALLAHPMATTTIAIAGPVAVLVLGLRSRSALQRSVSHGVLVLGLGLGVAAWWLLPMLDHRAYMASYGWLWKPLPWLLDRAREGQWAQNMPGAVGLAIALGLGLVAIAGTRAARVFAATALLCWIATASDLVWALRLDHLSEGFTHLQYQRFVIAAKPGLFLLAGVAIGWPIHRAIGAWRARSRLLAGGLSAVAAGLVVVVVPAQIDAMNQHSVGEIQRVRSPQLPNLDEDYAALLAWMQTQWAERDRFYRATVRDNRNLHWFMDAPVFTSMPLYKQGFTPGDNFVHKPEPGTPALLDALQVRYEIRRGRRGASRSDFVASFGQIEVFERPDWRDRSIAWVEGPGTIEVIDDTPDRGLVRVRVEGADASTRLVFGLGGYPRWHLEHEGEEIEWYEVPVLGDEPTATVASRRAGQWRGGKARGDDGTEPTLLAADASDGTYTLRYVRWRPLDIVAAIVSMLCTLVCLGLLIPGRHRPRLHRWLGALVRPLQWLGHPLALVALVAVIAIAGAVRHRRGAANERAHAVGWAMDERFDRAERLRAGFLKTDMLVRPALVVDRPTSEPAAIEFPDVRLADHLSGWVALDDDEAQVQPRGQRRIEIDLFDGDAWTRAFELAIPHRPGRHEFEVPTGALAGRTADVRVRIVSEGKSPPIVGFDLQLGEAS